MKKAPLWLLAGTLLLLACQLPFLPVPTSEPLDPDPPAPEPLPEKPEPPTTDNGFAIFKAGLVSSQHAVLDELSEASLYSIEFTIRDDILNTDGVETVRYTNQENVPLEEVHFRLLPNVLNGIMKVASVRINDQPFEPIYELQNSLMRVPLYEPLQPGESVEIKIEFSVTVPTELESNYGILAYFDNVLTLAHAYPMIAVYDDEGWNAEIPPNQGDPIYADASFFLVKVNAPAEFVLVASGRETSREETGNRQIVTYAAGPVRDFYLAASPDYELVSKTVGDVTYNSYAPSGLQGGSEMALDATIASFELFGEWYGPYPYTEYDIVSTPTYALGIEYPGMTAITDRIYDLDGTLSGTPNSIILESTIVHEAGHQWFYNMVGNDQLDEPWLDESLTQFITWEYYAEQYGAGGASGFENSLRGRWARVDNQPIPIGLPVAEYEGADYSAIIYGRGTFFFEALREEMGEEDFNAFMKDYVASNSWGIGTGETMKELAEKQCECNLRELFDAWVTP